MAVNARIGDLIEVPPVQTVIRLDEQSVASRSISETFVITSEVDAHLRVIGAALAKSTGQGYFLQGDFGSGKSHFLAALCAWIRRSDGSEKLGESHEELRASKGRRLLAVPISLVNYRATTPLERILVSSVEKALGKNADAGIVEPIDERLETFTGMIDKVTSAGFEGLVVLIDELSEYFRSKPDAPSLNEDARTLQLLGELARSNPVWIIAAVQESLERTGDIAQATFRKIKDRFPVKLQLSTIHIRDLISKRLIKVKPGADEVIYKVYQEYRGHFPGFKLSADQFRSIYPVHPLTLSLLEGLGELFSQHRGIVDFIHSRVAGDTSRGIIGILDRPCTELLAPDSIYDHFALRIAEFSSFYIYTSQIVPHLDKVIDDFIEDPEDKSLARRLVRILTLSAIHQTAPTLTVRDLAEVASCMLSEHDPGANMEYVAEVILDPIAEQSRFLSKIPAASGKMSDAVYKITTTDDHGKVLKARINRVINELAPDDSRILCMAIEELPESISWPGPGAVNGIERTVSWRMSARKAMVFFTGTSLDPSAMQKVRGAIDKGEIDFGVICAFCDIGAPGNHTAVWTVAKPEGNDEEILLEYLAAKLAALELKPGNPADQPLIPLLQEAIRRLEPAARVSALNCIYAGAFTNAAMCLDTPARSLKRFDRLLEVAAESMLEARYPRFKEIAPRSVPASMRLYQRLFDEFVTPGAIAMKDARAVGLTDAIETLAVPLGLVEVKSGQYVLSPNPSGHPFLSYFFGLLPSTAPVPLKTVVLALRTGPFGAPSDMAHFAVSSLAACGHLSIIRGGRSLPLEFIRMWSFDPQDAIAQGELIGLADRETIIGSCGFLFSNQLSGQFGLRQQRDAWQGAIKFKQTAQQLVADLRARMEPVRAYSAFDHFDLDAAGEKLRALDVVAGEIKSSYSAREGLERFLGSWRESKLTTDDLANLRHFVKFLSHNVEQFVFINHYVKHPCAQQAAQADAGIARHRNAVIEMIDNAERYVVPDEGSMLGETFEAFREEYCGWYGEAHRRHYTKSAPKPLSRHAVRSLDLIRRLAGIAPLDRPAGTTALLSELDKPAPHACARNLNEDLLRSPLCACGFAPGETASKVSIDASGEIDRVISEYMTVLSAPAIVEAVTARAFAVRDIDKTTADGLGRLSAFLSDRTAMSVKGLIDLLDEAKAAELAKALAGSVKVESRTIDRLKADLSGRRLTAEKVRSIVDNWIGQAGKETVLSLEEPSAQYGAQESAAASLWPMLHRRTIPGLSHEVTVSEQQVHALEQQLERRWPLKEIEEVLGKADCAALVSFIVDEPAYGKAIAVAWSRLCGKILNGETADFSRTNSCHLISGESKRISERLASLSSFQKFFRASFPDRLRARVYASSIACDPFADDKLKRAVDSYITQLSGAGEDWLNSLPPVRSISGRSSRRIICIVDAIAPDVWLEALDTMQIPGSPMHGWERLETTAKTVESMAGLLGLDSSREISEQLHALGIGYHSYTGTEEHPLVELLPHATASQVIRFSWFDKSVHENNATLAVLAERLRFFLKKQLFPFVDDCLEKKIPVVVTADHGVSYVKGKLVHGNGGVFEQAILKLVFDPASMR